MSVTPGRLIQEILEGEYLTVHYQPILSVRPSILAAYEGLVRGVHPITLRSMSPGGLFTWAAREGRVSELDLLCRKRVLEYFRAVKRAHPGLLLVINLSASEAVPERAKTLREEAETWDYIPSELVLEMRDDQLGPPSERTAFFEAARAAGFRVALDRVGDPGSRPHWISQAPPDIVKLGRSLVHNVGEDPYRQETFMGILRLAHRFGALAAASGLETEREARTALEAGVDWIQGKWIASPRRYDRLDPSGVLAPLEALEGRRKDDVLGSIRTRRLQMARYEALTSEMLDVLSSRESGDFEMGLHAPLQEASALQGSFVIDDSGQQVTEYVGRHAAPLRNHRAFLPPPPGTDHSTRDYFYMLMEGGLRRIRYVSDPVVSRSTGRRMVVLATAFRDLSARNHILCLELDADMLRAPEPFG